MDESDFEINFSALRKELKLAVEADQKYRRENDAKFRALHQKVATYEEFRDIVLASHLKPLDKKDRAGAPRKQPWNAVASSKNSRDSNTTAEIQAQPSDFHPRTASEFSRDWRRLGGGVCGRYGLLLGLGGASLRAIFSAEVGFGLLGELLQALCHGFQPAHWAQVLGVLTGLSSTPRFALNLSLLSSAESQACEELFGKIQKAAAADEELASDASRGDEKPSGDAAAIGDDSEHAAQNMESVDENPHEKLKYLMQIYGVPRRGP